MNDENIKTNELKLRKPFRDAEGSIFTKKIVVKTHTGRTRTETKYVARCRYTDLEGRRREKKRVCDSYNDAIAKRRELRDEIAKELDPANNLEEKPKTFSELADYYEAEYVKEAAYVKDRKIEGFRENLANITYQIKLFREHFGARLLKNIKYEDLRDYKLGRLKKPVVVIKKVKIYIDKSKREPKSRRQYITEKREFKSARSIASVNRELGKLKRIFYVAVQKGWLAENPFAKGDPLIKAADEVVRVRVMTPSEEQSFYNHCKGQNAHMQPIISVAIDTFMRRGELLKITWEMVDLEQRIINLPPKITKTLTARAVPLSSRAVKILEELKRAGGRKKDYVFPIRTIKTQFDTLRRKTGIKDLRFHDLRATGITRLLRKGMQAAEVMKFSGHSDYKTFMKYVRPDEDTYAKAFKLMDGEDFE